MEKFTASEKARILNFRDLMLAYRTGKTRKLIAKMSDEEYIESEGRYALNMIKSTGEGSVAKTVQRMANAVRWAKEAAKTGELEMSELPEVLQKEVAKEL